MHLRTLQILLPKLTSCDHFSKSPEIKQFMLCLHGSISYVVVGLAFLEPPAILLVSSARSQSLPLSLGELTNTGLVVFCFTWGIFFLPLTRKRHCIIEYPL